MWLVDNVAALMALVRGRSDSEDLDKLALMIHGLIYGLQVWIYFEWVESHSNWADGVSRYGYRDEWFPRNGFSFHTSQFHLAVWRLPFQAVMRPGAYL